METNLFFNGNLYLMNKVKTQQLLFRKMKKKKMKKLMVVRSKKRDFSRRKRSKKVIKPLQLNHLKVKLTDLGQLDILFQRMVETPLRQISI